MRQYPPKIIVILGPTSSGKSDYAIRLARKVGGEIISVDSRQVYRGMDIGTGKVVRDTLLPQLPCPRGAPESARVRGGSTMENTFFSEGVRHHLLDVASPKHDYNVTHFLRDVRKAIADIEKRGKVPILCGGTAFWAEALLLGTPFPKVKPDKKFRAKLGKLSAEALFAMLQEKDLDRAASIDPHNKVRIIRALEIIAELGQVPRSKIFNLQSAICNDARIIILNPPKETLHALIERRLKERLDQGMIDEVKHLRESGVSWKRLEGFGLEYRWCARLLQEKISREEMGAGLLQDIKHYAKRQLTYLRRMERKGLEMEWKTRYNTD